MPKIVQQIGKGIASNAEAAGCVADALGATLSGALWIAVGGTMSNGCVFAIVPFGAGAVGGCGRMLIRAVSFFGPAMPEPG
jgi:hypothetical protein